MLQDLEKGKITEVRMINGYVCQTGDKYGIDMAASVSLGDKPRDVEAGERAGVGRNLLFNGDYSEISL